VDESRSRIPLIHPADLIIEAPRALAPWVRARDWALTALVWLLYLWLISDVFVFSWRLFRWLFQGQPEPEQLSRAIALLGTLGSYVVVIVINAALLLAWAIYNQSRFRGHERRRQARPVSLEDLSRMYGFPTPVIAEWQAAPILVARLGDDGGLLDIEIRARPSAEAAPTKS